MVIQVLHKHSLGRNEAMRWEQVFARCPRRYFALIGRTQRHFPEIVAVVTEMVQIRQTAAPCPYPLFRRRELCSESVFPQVHPDQPETLALRFQRRLLAQRQSLGN